RGEKAKNLVVNKKSGESKRFSSEENKKHGEEETYILSLPIVKRMHFKYQSRQKLNQAIRRDLVDLKHKESTIDFKGWTTITGMMKSTNHLDNRLKLTEE
ncbi:14704_t:CDS:2, partial [Racocetra fulgida]